MRKLSKKISMLMVLAMLVSLFSGIVSASAAAPSSWSFKSSKYDVAVGETIEMEKNEYADFDLFRYDAAPEGYTVKWSSSDVDAVYVNGKTGQLRADKYGKADFGDKATISATFTNTTTGKSATRSFVIVVAEKAEYEIEVNFGDEVLAVGQKYDLAAVVKADGEAVEAKVEFAIDGKAIDAAYTPAAAGEFTIVTTATIDGKVVAEAKTAVVVVEAGLESAKQITYNTVALTFGSADVAKAVAADVSKLGSIYYFTANNEIQAFINTAKVDEKNANVVNVTLYNDIVKDVTYKFTYADKSATIVGVDRDQYASMTIATTEVPAGVNTTVKVNLYNADGVLVKAGVTTGFGLEAADSTPYLVPYYNNTVYFHEAGKVANVKATYWMGYDSNGNKIPDLTAVGAIVSYDATARDVSTITKWSLDGGANWSTNAATTVAFGENKQLMFEFNITDHDNKTSPEQYKGSNTWLAGKQYSVGFESSNPNVVLVDEQSTSGLFYPVGEGSAQIIVYRYPNGKNWEKTVMGVYTVNVIANRKLTSIAPTVSKYKLSSAADDSLKLYPNMKDQSGSWIGGTQGVELYAKLATTAPDGIVVTLDGNTINFAQWGDGTQIVLSKAEYDGTPYIEVKATNNVNWAERTFHIILTAKQASTGATLNSGVIAITTKAPGDAVSYAFDGVTGSFDQNLPADQWNDWYGRFATEITLSAYDNMGYLVDRYDTADLYTSLAAAKAAATAGNTFYYTYQKNYSDLPALTANTFEAVAVSGNELVKVVDPGTYVVTAYKYNKDSQKEQYLVTKSIVVSDSTAALTAVKLDNKLYGVTATNQVMGQLSLNEKIGFMRNGQRIWSNIRIVDVVSEVYVNANRVNVQYVWVEEDYGGNKVYTYKVPVFMTYETN